MAPERYRPLHRATPLHWSAGLSHCETACLLDYMTRRQYADAACSPEMSPSCCRILRIADTAEAGAEAYSCPCNSGSDNGIFTAIENCRADSLGDGHGLIHHVSHLAPRSGLGQASGIIIGTALGAALFFCIFGTCLCLCFNHIKRSKEERREERARDLAAVTSFPVPGSMVTPLEAAQTAPQQYIRKEDAAARAEAQIPRHPARFPEPYAEVRGYYEAANSSSTRQEPRGIELQAVQQLPRLA